MKAGYLTSILVLCLVGCNVSAPPPIETGICDVLKDAGQYIGREVVLKDAVILSNGDSSSLRGRHCKLKGAMRVLFKPSTAEAKERFKSLFEDPPQLAYGEPIQQECRLSGRIALEATQPVPLKMLVGDLKCGPRISDIEFVVRPPLVPGVTTPFGKPRPRGR